MAKFDRSSLHALWSAGQKMYGSYIGRHLHITQRLNAHTLAKRGSESDVCREAGALRFVKAHTSVPVPHVVDAWVVKPGQGKTAQPQAFLVTEWVAGEPFETAWPKMAPAQRAKATTQLKAYFAELRTLRQPVPGSVEPAVVEGTMFAGMVQVGPFPSVAEFHRFLKRFYGSKGHPAMCPEDYDDDGVAVVFSHGDLNPRNVLLDPSTGSVAAILGWGQAGWWPEYWEYRRAMGLGEHDIAWEEVVRQILPPPPAEDINASREESASVMRHEANLSKSNEALANKNVEAEDVNKNKNSVPKDGTILHLLASAVPKSIETSRSHVLSVLPVTV